MQGTLSLTCPSLLYTIFISLCPQVHLSLIISALSAKVCIEQEKAYYTSPAFNGSSTARDQVGNLLSKCLAGAANGDVDAMIKKVFEEAVAECEYNN